MDYWLFTPRLYFHNLEDHGLITKEARNLPR
jgi:hypothetical protein